MPIALSGRRKISSSRPRNTRRSLRSATNVGRISARRRCALEASAISMYSSAARNCARVPHFLSWSRRSNFLSASCRFPNARSISAVPNTAAPKKAEARSVVSSSYNGSASAHRFTPAKAWARQNLAHGSSRNRGSANKTSVSSGSLATTCASASFSATTHHSVSGRFLFNSACSLATATSGTPCVSGALASAISAEMSARANCASVPSRKLSPIFLKLISSPASTADIAPYD